MRDEPKSDDIYAPNPEVSEVPIAPSAPSSLPVTETQPQPFATSDPVSEPVDNPVSDPVGGPSVVSPTPVTPQPSKKRKNLIKAAIIAVAVLLVGGISGSVYAFVYQNPDKVVTDAFVNAMTAKTVSATGVFDVTGSDGYKAKIEFSGRNTDDGHAAMSVKFGIDTEELQTTINAEGVFSKEGDIYVKLSDIQKIIDTLAEQSGGFISLESFGTVIEKIDGNWIKIENTDLKDVSSELQETQKCTANITKLYNDDKNFRKTTLNEVEKLYKDNKFITIDKSLGSRTINGTGSLGYSILVDEAKTKTFFTGFDSTELAKKMKECDESISFTDFAKEFTTENEEKPEIEVWVSQFGHVLTEVSLASSDETSTGKMVINPVFNKSEAITIPTNTIGMEEIIADFQKAYEDATASYMSDMYTDMDDSMYMEMNSSVNYN